MAPPGATMVKTADGATLQLPQKSVPQTILLRQGGSGITIATPVSKAGSTGADDKGKADPNKPKLIPGKSALCKNCGTASPDFNTCIRCKKPLAKDCKVVEDKNSAKGNDQPTAAGGKGGKGQTAAEKVDSLRNVRILAKKKRAAAASDEPECIALSSDEDGEGDEEDETESGGEFRTFTKKKSIIFKISRRHEFGTHAICWPFGKRPVKTKSTFQKDPKKGIET